MRPIPEERQRQWSQHELRRTAVGMLNLTSEVCIIASPPSDNLLIESLLFVKYSHMH
jgi:hypothetical protein